MSWQHLHQPCVAERCDNLSQSLSNSLTPPAPCSGSAHAPEEERNHTQGARLSPSPLSLPSPGMSRASPGASSPPSPPGHPVLLPELSPPCLPVLSRYSNHILGAHACFFISLCLLFASVGQASARTIASLSWTFFTSLLTHRLVLLCIDAHCFIFWGCARGCPGST